MVCVYDIIPYYYVLDVVNWVSAIKLSQAYMDTKFYIKLKLISCPIKQWE